MLQRGIRVWALVCVVLWCSVTAVAAQQPTAAGQELATPAQHTVAAKAEPEAPRVVLQAETTASVLRLMKFSGGLRDPAGNPRSGAVGMTYALYKEQQGGSPLWLEVHNAQLDEQGRYTVLLGSTKNEGLPLELFSTGEARWLGVQVNLPGEEEQARVLLVSVPYALKAADAETLGGKPPSAFLLADPVGADLRVRPDAGKEAVKEGPRREGVVGPINGEGSLNMVAKFTGPNNIGNGSIFDNGNVGIGTTAPNVKLSLGTDLTAQKLALYDGPGDFYGLGLGSGRIAFHASNTEKMTLTSGGRLGLGTVAPNVKLSLGTDVAAQKLALYDGASDFYGLGLESGRIVFHTGNTEKMTLTSGGRLGLGTVAPNVKLSLGTDVAAQKLALYDGASDFYGLGLEAGRMVFHTGNTEKMTLTAGGNLGIGVTAPTEKLEVAGNVKASNLTVSGSINGGLRVLTTAGTPNVIGGFSGNSVSGGVVGATISGGGESGNVNSVTQNFGTVGGGRGNTASGDTGTVGGGLGNTASNFLATVGGGAINIASGNSATVPGGDSNTAAGTWSFAAGRRAKANHTGAFVWGDSTFADIASTAPNQFLVRASGGAFFLGGNVGVGTAAPTEKLEVAGNLKLSGSINAGLRVETTLGTPNVIGGLSGNSVSGGVVGATISGGGESGFGNSVGANYGTVGGGMLNAASGERATVGGGQQNTASGFAAMVGGGSGNTASGPVATVGGGDSNTASGSRATVGGGELNTASGNYATVGGGQLNTAAGPRSFAAGRLAKANHQGAFVWGDDSNSDVASTAVNEFTARATGGVRFITAIDGTTGAPTAGVSLGAGASAWAALSDRNSKENFAEVDGRTLLDRLARIPVLTWNWRAQPASIRHMGPMAQNFRAAFGLGEDDKHISTVDADGVALAAIQALHQLSLEKDRKIEELTREVRELRSLVQRAIERRQ